MKTYQYVHNDDTGFEVREDDAGDRYVERSALARGYWACIGLAIAGICGWFALEFDGPEGWLLTTATPATIAAFALGGVVAEATVGSDRSEIVRVGDTEYLEMLPSSRWYALSAAVAVVATAVSMFLAVQAPGLAGTDGRRGGIVALADVVPLGEYLLLVVAALFSYGILKVAMKGRMPVEPVDD